VPTAPAAFVSTGRSLATGERAALKESLLDLRRALAVLPSKAGVGENEDIEWERSLERFLATSAATADSGGAKVLFHLAARARALCNLTLAEEGGISEPANDSRALDAPLRRLLEKRRSGGGKEDVRALREYLHKETGIRLTSREIEALARGDEE